MGAGPRPESSSPAAVGLLVVRVALLAALMTHTCTDLTSECAACEHERRIAQEGREIANLLDSGRIDGRLRAEVIGAKSAAGWSAAARVLVEGLS